jgi:hypothetical protein
MLHGMYSQAMQQYRFVWNRPKDQNDQIPLWTETKQDLNKTGRASNKNIRALGTDATAPPAAVPGERNVVPKRSA